MDITFKDFDPKDKSLTHVKKKNPQPVKLSDCTLQVNDIFDKEISEYINHFFKYNKDMQLFHFLTTYRDHQHSIISKLVPVLYAQNRVIFLDMLCDLKNVNSIKKKYTPYGNDYSDVICILCDLITVKCAIYCIKRIRKYEFINKKKYIFATSMFLALDKVIDFIHEDPSILIGMNVFIILDKKLFGPLTLTFDFKTIRKYVTKFYLKEELFTSALIMLENAFHCPEKIQIFDNPDVINILIALIGNVEFVEKFNVMDNLLEYIRIYMANSPGFHIKQITYTLSTKVSITMSQILTENILAWGCIDINQYNVSALEAKNLYVLEPEERFGCILIKQQLINQLLSIDQFLSE